MLAGLRSMPDESVHCIVTSPPYWGLRDYGKEGQIGQETTPQDYVAKMVEVFREARRVLRKDGTCWLNLGDTYNGIGGPGKQNGGPIGKTAAIAVEGTRGRSVDGLKKKDLIGVPWRVAFGLQEDGWYLRQDIIWSKPSAMPESVRDRCTKSHEYIFLMTKAPKYFFDDEAIKEKAVTAPHAAGYTTGAEYAVGPMDRGGNSQREGDQTRVWGADGMKNRRSVWSLSPHAFRGAHFATFPASLPERCLKAGASQGGCCSVCGAFMRRVTSREKLKRKRPNDFTKRTGEAGTGNSCSNSVAGVSVETLGWQASCKCNADTRPCVVMDIFSGAATTGVVAKRLGLRYIGLELNPEYAEMGRQRIENDQGEKAKPKKKRKDGLVQPSLFEEVSNG